MAAKEKSPPRPSATRAPIGGRYEIGDLIGAGGMGRVHEGYDRVLGRSVAVKVLDESRARDPRFVEAFRREARAAAALHHPNVVSVFDSGQEDGLRYIVMERIRGRTLREVLAEEGPLEPDRAVAIAGQIAAALAAAHHQGLVHRDIKPGNVMLTQDGSVRVMDFGIARAVDEESRTGGMVLGTATYLPPEQARGRGVSPAGDVYSLGCVLYEMLTGRPPFVGENPVATVCRHVSEVPVPPSEVVDGIPPALEALVLRAMAKEPERRFRDGRRFGGALAAAALHVAPDGAALDTAPVSLPGGARRHRLPVHPLRRFPVGVFGVGVILAVALLISPTFISSRAPSPPARAGVPAEVEVPDVVGLTEAESVEVLHSEGLIPRLLDGAVDDGIEYIVVDQVPAPGASVDPGSFVTLRLTLPESDQGQEGQEGRRGAVVRDDGSSQGRVGKPNESEGGEREGSSPGRGTGPDPESSPTPSPSPSPSPTPSPTPSPVPSPSPPGGTTGVNLV